MRPKKRKNANKYFHFSIDSARRIPAGGLFYNPLNLTIGYRSFMLVLIFLAHKISGLNDLKEVGNEKTTAAEQSRQCMVPV